jgi:hypothetical protein
MGEKTRVKLAGSISVVCILAMAFFLLLCPGLCDAAEGSNPDYPESFVVPLQFSELEMIDNSNGTTGLFMEGYPSAREIGLPAIPSRVLAIAMPPGTKAAGVSIEGIEWYEVPGSYTIEWGQEPLPSDTTQAETPPATQADAAVYNSDAVFPEQPVLLQGTGRMRKYSIADIRISPVRYYPQSGRIEACRSMSIRVDTAPGEELSLEELADPCQDKIIIEIIDNYSQAQPWYEQASPVQYESLITPGTEDAADYMIITTEELALAVDPLKAYKEIQGLSVQVKSVEWIEANVSGIDLAEKIRNYLRDNYASLGIDYVLLAGTSSTVPMRRCYAINYIPTDYYYCDLSGNWDLNDDGRYGELGIDDQAGGVDFYPEVYVGRIPTDDAGVMTSICEKIVDYSQDPGDWKHNVLLLGAVSNYLLESTGILPTYGSTLMERIKIDILDPLGYESTTMYEMDGVSPDPNPCDLPLTNENVLSEWATGYGIVNMAGHGSAWSIVRKVWWTENGNGIPESSEMRYYNYFDEGDAAMLDDTHPSIVFSSACGNAYPEIPENLMASLLANGACATVGATRLSYYVPGWQSEYWGGNRTVSYMFWKSLLLEDYRIGKALRMALVWHKNNCDWLGNFSRANIYDFNLYGDPSMKLDAEGSPSVSSIDPQSAWNMGSLTVNITGSNFLDGAQIRLSMAGQSDIEATAVTVDSSTRISATLDIAGAPVGDWDIVVRNPDGQEAVLEDAFAVTTPCGEGGGAAALMLGLGLGMLYLAGAGGLIRRRRRRR